MEMRPGYKRTDIGVIPEDWEVTTLGEVCTFENGDRGRNYPSPGSFLESGIPFINAGHLAEGKINLSGMNYITSESYDRLGSGKVRAGDILFCLRGSLGKYGIVREGLGKGAIASSLIIVRPKSRTTSREYLGFYFGSALCEQMIDLWSGGAVQPNLGAQDLARFSMALPPTRAEQRAIAEVLSDADGLLGALDRLIAKKRSIKEATMHELLTGKIRLPGFSGPWKVKTVEEAFRLLRTASNSRSDLSPDGNVKYIHYGDVHTKWSRYLDCQHDDIPLIHERHLSKVPFLEDGDLVMVDASEDYEGIGASVEVKNATGRRVVAGLHTLLLRGDKDLLADGFKAYIQHIPSFKEDLIEIATGTSVYGVSKSRIQQVPIPLPPLPEQRAIATVLSDMEAEIAALEARRDKTRALKQGMMQELLTGRIRLV